MYYRNRSIRTADYNAWGQLVLQLLEPHLEELTKLKTEQQLHGGYFTIQVLVDYPKHIYLNRHGQISSKTFDVDNVLKPLIDVLFGKCMLVDDKHIVYLSSAKQPGASYQIHILLALVQDIEFVPLDSQ